MCIFKTKRRLSSKLKSVIIYNCQGFELDMLKENTILEELQIIHSGIVDINNIINFKNLKFLKVAYCNVISIPAINVLENLEQLCLNHIKIQYNIDISKMTNLKLISLNGSNVSNKKEYIKNLHEQRKELTIEFEENDLPVE